MSVKSIREHEGKALLKRWLPEYSKKAFGLDNAGCMVTPGVLDSKKGDDWNAILEKNPWLKTHKLVAKPDQMIGGRGKAGLIAVNKSFEEVKAWINERMCKDTTVAGITGQLTHFLIEPFVPHEQSEEFYVCIQSHRYKDEIFFYHEGGVDVGDVDSKASKLAIPTGCEISEEMIRLELLGEVTAEKQKTLASFIKALFTFYKELHFAYLEINPIAMLPDNKIVPLDLVAKIDETASFLCAPKWGELDWPSPFGRAAYPEEALIRDLDGKTGASLKLTVLNDKGRVWTMVAGGGASVVYSDTVADYGWGSELANYGEYSGAPSTEETFTYAKTILSLMCRYKHPDGKFLIIGGGIANFTDVAATFTGLIKALDMFAEQIKEHKIHIWCRRAGPNYLEGLKKLKVASQKLGLGVKVDCHGIGCFCTARGAKPAACHGMLWPLHGSCCVAVLCQIAAVKRRGEGNFSLAADRQKVAPMLVPVLRRKLLSLLKAEEYVTYRVVLNQQSVNLRGLGVKDFYKPIPALEDDDVVEEFIHQNGFTSIFQRDPAGWLPLHYASLRGSVQVIQGLLAMRANPNQKTTKDQPLVGLPQFTSALTICVYFRHYEATQLLISAKASLTGGIRTLCAARCSVHHRNLLGASVFDTACAHGTIQAVEELLRQTGGDGIDMTCALHVAMTHHGGSAELVKRLVDFRADVNDQSFTWWRAGTGLGLLSIQKAIQRKFGKQTLCTKMTYHGGHGGTPLMLAMLSSQYEGAAALVALGVRVEPQNAGGGGRRILLKERRQTPTFGI